MTTKPSKLRTRRRNRLLLAAIVGGVLGMGCGFVPPHYQAPCHLAAKVFGFLLGAS